MNNTSPLFKHLQLVFHWAVKMLSAYSRLRTKPMIFLDKRSSNTKIYTTLHNLMAWDVTTDAVGNHANTMYSTGICKPCNERWADR